MEKPENQGTDGASIKKVSSLLSHFEGLKTQHKLPHRDAALEAAPELKPGLDTPRSTFPVRASLDLPRPSSQWTASADTSQPAPRTPKEPQKGRISPTRSSHKRPMSMHISSSPQLTPAVNIESPRSPPYTFFQRSASRSPERPDNTPFGKVRELISQHSSRSSTRHPSPGIDEDVSTNKHNSQLKTDSPYFPRSASPTKQPPPVNRAEKPRIPVKPLAISQASSGRLTPEPRRPSMDTRVSPFSTPPSSAENSPEASPIEGSSAFSNTGLSSSPEKLQAPVLPGFVNAAGSRITRDGPITSTTSTTTPRSTDPRLMGFSALPTVPERRDPRSLGFSAAPRTSTIEQPVVPTRANTVAERSTPRDPRDLGLSVSRPTPRAVSESVRQTPPPPPVTHQQHHISAARNTPLRDARQYGFSAATSATAVPLAASEIERRPSLPARRLPPQDPPPRPSEVSKPGTRAPNRESPHRSADSISRTATPQPIRSVAPPSEEAHFPPPPKRNTFNEADPTRGPLAQPLSRSMTVGSAQQPSRYEGDDSDEAEKSQDPTIFRTDYPDSTHTNRRPPYNLDGNFEIPTRSEGRVFDVCGKYLCVAGYNTRVFDMSTGEQILSINHGETVKITAAKFKPGIGLEDEGQFLWLGNNIGDLQEVDVLAHSIVGTNSSHNRREIVRILRSRRNLWTLDDDGRLLVWRTDETGTPNFKYTPTAHKTPRGHTFSMVVQDKFWLATGKELRVYRPGNESQFMVFNSPLIQQGTGDVTSGTYSTDRGGKAYFGHTDGKVTIYSTSEYTCLGTVKISDYKINGLSFVGDRLWAAYKTGMVYVYDVSTTPWRVKKDWRAHQGPAHGLVLDPSSVWTLQRLQVVTAGHDNYVRMWDATLEEDWIESMMQESDVQYCAFRELRAAIVTWNVGATVPSIMRSDFIADAIHSEDPPEILVFGFQEVVDLEDRAVTAKSLLGFAKKKDTAKTEQHQSRIYREWRDYLARCIGRYTDAQYSYSELNTSSLIGLFQCVFIRQEERRNVSMLSATNIKCGMGGHYGNKGALVTRFVLDDSSLCFINCHLAAGQSHTSHRNNDIATILESESLAVETQRQIRSSLFVGGGDGTQILDHEICILNGDLNYRIDTIPRDTVIKMIKQNDLAKLLERDQIMVSRRRVSGFRLSPFTELPITFAPTYKYDVNSDEYDSSEKKRSPAWCDRILYRGPGKVKQIEYRRHEVRVSDHRPVSGLFKLRIKKIDVPRRDRVMGECHERFKDVKKKMLEGVCVRWLVDVVGVSEGEAKRLLVAR